MAAEPATRPHWKTKIDLGAILILSTAVSYIGVTAWQHRRAIGAAATNQAVKAIARRGAVMKTGARALRTILEEVMLDLMYEIPALGGVKSVVITEEVIAGIGQPQILT